MAEEDVTVEVTVGDYAGKRLTMPAAVAKQAIKDGWARDPFAPPSDEPPPEIDREKAALAAEKALRKLRGEEDADQPKAAPKPAVPEGTGTSETRTSRAKK